MSETRLASAEIERRLSVLEGTVRSLTRSSVLPDTHRFVRPSEFAAQMGRSRGWAHGLIRKGELRAVLLDNVQRIPYLSAVEWINQHQIELIKEGEKIA